MSDGLQRIRFPKGISGYIPPPGFAPRATVANARLNELFNVMTSCEGVSQFKDIISKSDRKASADGAVTDVRLRLLHGGCPKHLRVETRPEAPRNIRRHGRLLLRRYLAPVLPYHNR
uniref:Uncharacterized protein n=1 Tax=Brassica campestris TaxID=3711 RepID=A0A3P6DGH4_BRACM|nr:unnamed protein product [Brassica rapa]